jgi:hypothetical protein
LSQRWFQRVWILQEVANARDALVYCGAKSVSAFIFAISIRLLGLPIDRHAYYKTIRVVTDLMPGPSRKHPYQDFCSLLRKFRYTEATNNYDKIYALFGMSEDPQISTTLKTSYETSVKDVIHSIMSCICQCDMEAIANVPYHTIDHFLDGLDSLDNIMLLQFLNASDIKSAFSPLEQCGKYIHVTLQMPKMAANNAMQKERVIEHLLRQEGAKEALLGTNEGGWTPLWWAAANGHDDVCEFRTRPKEASGKRMRQAVTYGSMAEFGVFPKTPWAQPMHQIPPSSASHRRTVTAHRRP